MIWTTFYMQELINYLKRAVHQSLIQVYYHTLLPIVIYVNLRQEILLWRLWKCKTERVNMINMEQVECNV